MVIRITPHKPTNHLLSNAYPPYDQRPRTTANYAIYPSANNDTFIYEQSTCSKSDLFSNSELDSPTTDDFSPFSPAMSTDSTITLPRTTIGDLSGDDPRIPRSATPAPRSGYPSASTAPPPPAMMGRTASSMQGRSATATTTPMRIPMPSSAQVDPLMQMPPPYINIPEYEPSTFSEMEVNQRDLLAKRNAELNSTPTASFYSSSSGSAGSSDADRRRGAATSQNPGSAGREAFTRVASSQPLHPSLHFPIRSQESEYTQTAFQASTSTAPAAFPSMRENSPPRVERLPSQLPPEVAPSQSGTQSTYSYASLPVDSWSRDATVFESEHPRSTSYRTSPKNGAESFDTGSAPSSRPGPIYTASAQQDNVTFNDYRQDRAPSAAPLERSRSRRTSILGPRPDLSSSRPLSEVRDYTLPPRGPPDPRQVDEYGQKRQMDPISSSSIYTDRRDAPNSPPRGPADQTSSRDPSNRAADYRRDTRTPSPREREDAARVSRRDSYAQEPLRSSKDPRSKPPSPTDQREYLKSVPLSSSPTQLRASPTEMEPTSSRYPPQGRSFLPPEGPERVRARSISFSNTSRPTANIPIQVVGQLPPPQPLPYPPGGDPRYASEYDRSHRSGDRPFPPRSVDPLHSITPGIYYSQAPGPDYENPSQRQAASTSRAIDKSASAMQAPYSRVSPSQEVPSSRSRAPPYVDPPHYSQLHAEPVRRHSDGDKPFDPNLPLPRSSPPHEKPPQQTFKVMNPSPSPPIPSPDHPRRNSDGDQSPPLRLPLTSRTSAPLLRSVRWNDNLVCPSPIPSSHRRKGWFNRRG